MEEWLAMGSGGLSAAGLAYKAAEWRKEFSRSVKHRIMFVIGKEAARGKLFSAAKEDLKSNVTVRWPEAGSLR